MFLGISGTKTEDEIEVVVDDQSAGYSPGAEDLEDALIGGLHVGLDTLGLVR